MKCLKVTAKLLHILVQLLQNLIFTLGIKLNNHDIHVCNMKSLSFSKKQKYLYRHFFTWHVKITLKHDTKSFCEWFRGIYYLWQYELSASLSVFIMALHFLWNLWNQGHCYLNTSWQRSSASRDWSSPRVLLYMWHNGNFWNRNTVFVSTLRASKVDSQQEKRRDPQETLQYLTACCEFTSVTEKKRN